MEKEHLDFCRVKKIFDKGFGFLSSLYYSQDVFFHFSKIKEEGVKKELEKLKRGVVYIYYTSQSEQGKRKVSKMWLNLNNVPKHLISDFKGKIIDGLNDGKTNVFELIHIIKELKSNGEITRAEFGVILKTKKIRKNPSVLIQMFNDEELKQFKDINKYFDNIREQKIDGDIWSLEIANMIYTS